MTDIADTEFQTLTDPFRKELLAHCYRMLGSIQDAEDMVQETYLRAWRSFDRFEGRSSLRVWMYKIATMTCLTALETRRRRPLPSDLSAPSHDAGQRLETAEAGMVWMQPIPDGVVTASPTDPAAVVSAQSGIRLAFISALQSLSARQRAVLILRDVLAMRAAEVAEILDTTTVAVNGLLQRARATLKGKAMAEEEIIEPIEAELRAILDRYVDAFERADVNALVGLLRADVELEMPPIPTWFSGRDAVCGFLSSHALLDAGTWMLVPTRANSQAAVAVYRRQGDGRYSAHEVHVLTFIGDRISRITVFFDAHLFPLFGLQPLRGGRAAR
jgi:RNA polymerase sigma-70 factor (ECF subfamily)